MNAQTPEAQRLIENMKAEVDKLFDEGVTRGWKTDSNKTLFQNFVESVANEEDGFYFKSGCEMADKLSKCVECITDCVSFLKKTGKGFRDAVLEFTEYQTSVKPSLAIVTVSEGQMDSEDTSIVGFKRIRDFNTQEIERVEQDALKKIEKFVITERMKYQAKKRIKYEQQMEEEAALKASQPAMCQQCFHYVLDRTDPGTSVTTGYATVLSSDIGDEVDFHKLRRYFEGKTMTQMEDQHINWDRVCSKHRELDTESQKRYVTYKLPQNWKCIHPPSVKMVETKKRVDFGHVEHIVDPFSQVPVTRKSLVETSSIEFRPVKANETGSTNDEVHSMSQNEVSAILRNFKATCSLMTPEAAPAAQPLGALKTSPPAFSYEPTDVYKGTHLTGIEYGVQFTMDHLITGVEVMCNDALASFDTSTVFGDDGCVVEDALIAILPTDDYVPLVIPVQDAIMTQNANLASLTPLYDLLSRQAVKPFIGEEKQLAQAKMIDEHFIKFMKLYNIHYKYLKRYEEGDDIKIMEHVKARKCVPLVLEFKDQIETLTTHLLTDYQESLNHWMTYDIDAPVKDRKMPAVKHFSITRTLLNNAVNEVSPENIVSSLVHHLSTDCCLTAIKERVNIVSTYLRTIQGVVIQKLPKIE